jgi:hypothetical protein
VSPGPQRHALWDLIRKTTEHPVIGGLIVVSILAIVKSGSIKHFFRGSPSVATATSITTNQRSTHKQSFRPVFLDTLAETNGDQVTAGLVSIDGRTYQHGLQFTFAAWEIPQVETASYSIPNGARTFSSVIGNDDTEASPGWNEIHLTYELFVNDRRVAIRRAFGRTHDPPIRVQLSGGGTLTLQVTSVGPDGNETNADWGEPVFN